MGEYISCGSSSLLSLSDDVLGIIGKSLSTRDICNLSMSCKTLNVEEPFEKIWLVKCEELGVLSSSEIVAWRGAVLSYKALCRFLTSVKPLLGIWVNEEPQLGNVVYVMPSFASVVGCRVIPQEVGPTGIEGGSTLWAPVFEVVSNGNGALIFVLHGREKGQDYIYPGTVRSIEKTCDALLLEVETKQKNNKHKKKESTPSMSFQEMSFGERLHLLETVTGNVRVKDSDGKGSRNDVPRSSEHREMLIKMHEVGAGYTNWIFKWEDISGIRHFLKSRRTVGLTLHATAMGLSYYQSTWPYMNAQLFALYKLPVVEPAVDREYAGLWGGTFGWPTREPTENKALFLVVVSYKEELPAQRLLLATKILEGSKSARRPNGSTMFSVDIDKPSTESPPWNHVGVTQAFAGEGIANGYGFSYPGSSPGSLFVLEDGMLAFLWTETESVVTLQRLNLDELLRNGQRVPPLSPILNFSFRYKSQSNVFTKMIS